MPINIVKILIKFLITVKRQCVKFGIRQQILASSDIKFHGNSSTVVKL
jgi:hypothetical protein